MSDDLLLSLVWAVPLAGALVVLALPAAAHRAIRYTALGVSLATLAASIALLVAYLGLQSADGSVPSLAERAARNIVQIDEAGYEALRVEDAPGDLVVRRPWVPYFHIEYYLGIDGISLSLVLLTGLVSSLACLASWNITRQVKGYFALFLLLVASMMGVFLSLDMFLFYVFFEVMLLPMYFLIAVWGGPNREYAAIKFLLYTLFGSVFILVAILILYFWSGTPGSHMVGGEPYLAHTFDAVRVAEAASRTTYYEPGVQSLVFVLFFLGFAVKLPSFPFHTWLPDAHVEAPTPISMILAGILLKIGGYGWIRLAWPLAPVGAEAWAWWVAALGVFSILYGALAAMAQSDFKKLVAYSSVSHMGYVTLGLAAINLVDPRYYAYGVNGAMYMQIAHGITSSGMFFLVGVIYDRAHTRQLNELGGLVTWMPFYSAVSFVIFFGAMGLPGLCGFIAEIFVVLAAFGFDRVLAVLAAVAVILTAGYILWTLQRVFLGKNEKYRDLPDLTPREWVIAVPLVVLTVLLGVLPHALLLSWMGPSVSHVVEQVTRANIAQRDAGSAVAAVPPVARER
jgi:NADH-quinone oxidoreductase subunit M